MTSLLPDQTPYPECFSTGLTIEFRQDPKRCAILLCLKKRYYEIQVNSGESAQRRVVHVVTLNDKESPIHRAVAEGLLPRDQAQKATIRELSVDDCLKAWQQEKWRKQ